MIAYFIIAVEIAVLLLALVPALRVLVKPAVRRECRENPWMGFGLAIGVSAAGLALLWLVTNSAESRLAVVLIAGVLGLVAYLHARTSYGSHRGLPPGSLGLATSLDAITEPDFYADSARRWGPVVKMSQWYRPVACITDLRLASRLLDEQADSLRQVVWTFDRLVPGGYVEFMDGQRHAHYRELFAPGFGDSVIAACHTDFLDAIRTNLDSLASASEDRGVDPTPWLERIALDANLRIVLGIRASDSRVAAFPDWLAGLDAPIGLVGPVRRSTRQAFRQLTDTVRRLSSDEVAPSMLAAVQAAGREAVEDEVVIGNLVVMVQDGRIMLRRLLQWIVKFSADQSVVTAAGGTQAGDLSPEFARAFVLETLRLSLAEYVNRRTVGDCDLGGYRIPEGWLVRICLREAHRRADVFPQPERFDPARFLGRDYGPEVFWPFSVGPHACLADRYSTALGELFVIELHRHFRLTVAQDAEPERDNRHWAFWTPGRQFRVRLVVPRSSKSLPWSDPDIY